jgi:hypothetical protein
LLRITTVVFAATRAGLSVAQMHSVLYPAGPSPTKEELKSKLVAKQRHIEALQKRVQLGVNHSQKLDGVMQNLFQGVQQAAQQQQQLNQWAGPTATSCGEFEILVCQCMFTYSLAIWVVMYMARSTSELTHCHDELTQL